MEIIIYARMYLQDVRIVQTNILERKIHKNINININKHIYIRYTYAYYEKKED